VNCFVENDGLIVELAANVDVRSASTHGKTSDEAALDELVGVLPHDFTILIQKKRRIE
jgi:hypothetical protein